MTVERLEWRGIPLAELTIEQARLALRRAYERINQLHRDRVVAANAYRASRNQTIPDMILVNSEFFNRDVVIHETLQCKVSAILRDSLGDQYCVFETSDMAGLHTIHLGSVFFLGWTSDPAQPEE